MASSCQGGLVFTHLLFISTPCQVPAIFDGTRLLVYRLLPKSLPEEGLKVRTANRTSFQCVTPQLLNQGEDLGSHPGR